MSLLRKMFGPSKDEIWQQLSQELGGEFVPGTWKQGSKMQVKVREWTITLDSYLLMVGKVPVTYTRLRAPYVNPDGFRFRIYKQGFWSEVATSLGGQDVQIGNPDFDQAWVLKGTDEIKVQQLFASAKLQELLTQLKEVHLEVKDDEGWFATEFPEGVDELSLVEAGELTDLKRLKLLYELFAETLNRLTQTGSAYETDPGVIL